MTLLGLSILVTFLGTAAQGTVIRSPRVTDWGIWGEWEACESGKVAVGFQLKVEYTALGWGDDTALNAIKLFCGQPGSRKSYSEITSTVGPFGDWEDPLYCDDGVITGFQLNSEKKLGNGLDDSAANNFRGICSLGEGNLEGKGNNFGKWTAEQHCPTGEAICAIQTQVEPDIGGGDDTSLNNVDFRCCKIPAPDCAPSDAWVPVSSCDNRQGSTPLTCRYEQAQGISKSRSSSNRIYQSKTIQASGEAEKGAEFKGLSQKFKVSLSQSQTTGHTWSQESSRTWSSETKHMAEYIVPPFKRTVLKQVVGQCGDYFVYTSSIMKVDPE